MSDVWPPFRYHPDPLASGSVAASDTTCACCNRSRGFVYVGPVFSETDNLEEHLCPWCIADGKAHQKFDATFVDSEALDAALPASVAQLLVEQTPGFHSWQSGRWPSCCGDATAFVGPFGIEDLRHTRRELEGLVLSHIIYDMGISGGAATRLLNALQRDQSPTGYLFQCLACQTPHIHVDHL